MLVNNICPGRVSFRGVVEGERVGTAFPHFSLSPKNVGAKNERSIIFLHLLKVVCVERSHTSKFSTTILVVCTVCHISFDLDNEFSLVEYT